MSESELLNIVTLHEKYLKSAIEYYSIHTVGQYFFLQDEPIKRYMNGLYANYSAVASAIFEES